MARDFDGTNDQIAFGSDASIDNLVALTVAFDMLWDGAGVGDVILGKANNAADGWRITTDSSNLFAMTRDYASALGAWATTTAINGTTPRHYLASHDGVVTSDTRFVLDGVVDTTVEQATPSGALDADAASNLIAGESSAGTSDFDGKLQNLVIYAGVFTAAEENRCRWWGVAPGGPSTVLVWHPFYTEALANKGTATATGTATGTTVASLPRPNPRPGFALMGMGVGW